MIELIIITLQYSELQTFYDIPNHLISKLVIIVLIINPLQYSELQTFYDIPNHRNFAVKKLSERFLTELPEPRWKNVIDIQLRSRGTIPQFNLFHGMFNIYKMYVVCLSCNWS